MGEPAIIADYQSGLSLCKVAEKHGFAIGTVRNALVRNGVQPRHSGPQPQPLSSTKVCSACGLPFPRADFYGDGRRTSVCKTCILEKSSDKYQSSAAHRQKKLESAAAWQKLHPEQARSKKRLWSSGWTQAQFEEAWLKQEGRCDICQLPMLMRGREPTSVCADHDHVTGKPRALLCRGCNLHLGIYETSAAI